MSEHTSSSFAKVLEKMDREYSYQDDFTVTDEMKNAFNDKGCLMVRGLLSKAEVDHAMKSMQSEEFKQFTFGIPDGAGGMAHITVWNQPGQDITGMIARSEKIAGTCEQLIGGEVYHYHSKLMGKPAREGGKHLWHQDYGYWYKNGCLFPNMLTVFIAIDDCEKKNGCLQFLPGSQKCGRVEHNRLGGQFEADLDRVEEIQKVFPKQYAEMKPGDALFMHCNVLHCSSANTSEFRRWALLCCYNRADNNPVIEHHHPQYTPLIKVDNSAILSCSKQCDKAGKAFMPQNEDKTSLLEELEEK